MGRCFESLFCVTSRIINIVSPRISGILCRISDVNVSDLSSLNPDHLHPKIVSVTGATKALEAKVL